MNLKTINVVMLISGVVLMYSGIKGYKPASVLAWALGGPKPSGWGAASGTQLGGQYHNGVAPGQHPGDMPYTYPSDPNTSSASLITNPTAGGIVSV